MSDLKTYNNAEFACNGGAFFWVAYKDINGQWSDAVVAEVEKTKGCSNPTPKPTANPTTRAPTTALPTSPPTAFAWTQLGSDIDGEGPGDNFGMRLALSRDGSVLAVGAPNNNQPGRNDAGHVRVYQYMGNVWTQLGNDVDGENAGDISGISVSLSTDGMVLAVGATANGGFRGHVRVFQYVSGTNTWTQIGSDINGEVVGDRSGRSVSLSGDGSVVAIGAANNNNDSGTAAGHVRVYKYISPSWTQLGIDLDGEGQSDWFGRAVSLSSDGMVLAIGGERNDPNGNDDAGHVRVYQFVGNVWTQLGTDIDGEAPGDFSGSAISLSSNGMVLAVGAPWNSNGRGHVRVYQYLNNVWTQLGSDIDGEDAGDHIGAAGDNHCTWVSLSSDGMVVAVGARYNNPSGPTVTVDADTGHVRVYQYSNNAWNQLGREIDGLNAGEDFGTAVSLSGDGTMLAVGAPSIGNGLVRVFSDTFTTDKPSGSPSDSPSFSSNPTGTRKPTNSPTTRSPTTSKPSSLPTSDKPSSHPTSKPSAPPTVAPPCGVCPPGATGNYPTANCYGFLQCVSGVLRGTTSCHAGTIFDVRLGVCNWSYAATCQCGGTGPAPPLPATPNPTTSKPKTSKPTSKPATAMPTPPPGPSPLAAPPPSPPTTTGKKFTSIAQ